MLARTLCARYRSHHRQAIFKVEIYMKFVDPVVDVVMVPLPRVHPPRRPYFATPPRPAIVNAQDETLLNHLTPPTRTCSKTKSQ
jgi:hypothetical protein